MALFRVCTVVLALYCLGQATSPAGQTRSIITNARKNKMIAEMAGKFSRLIEWPKQSNVSQSSKPFVIGLIGNKAEFAAFKLLYAKKKIHNKVVLLKPIVTPEEIKDCNLLFFSNSDKRDRSRILASIKNSPVLTIGDSPDFIRLGGHIALTFSGRALKFKVSISSLKCANLKATGHLLNWSDKLLWRE